MPKGKSNVNISLPDIYIMLNENLLSGTYYTYISGLPEL